MADDKEILREVWDGKLPICFKLSADECTITEPDEVYLMVSRQTYLPLVTDKVQRYFSEYVDSAHKNNEIWFDHNDIPLKWHYPVGLLYDLYATNSRDEPELPWRVNVHFDKFPEDELLHCPNKEVIEAQFISTIKEADALKHKGKVMNDLQKRDNKQLWHGLQNDKFDQFWSVNKKLMEPHDGDGFKHIPFRIYQNDKHYVQKLFQPSSESGEKRTLRDLLSTVVGSTDRKVIIQGVSPSLDTPIQWLSEHLSHPDNFLHICLK